MSLWAERQVKKDLGIVVHRRKPQSFGKLFQTPPHVEYIAREAKTAGRLRRLIGTNVVELTNFAYMDTLEHETVRAYQEDLQARMDERAHQAAELAHIQLWESVLRGQSDLPVEKLDDPCMRQVRQHQLKIEGLHKMAVQLGTSVQRVATMPHVWAEPSRYKPRKRKVRSPSPPASSETKISRKPRLSTGSHRSSPRSQPTSVMTSKGETKNLCRTDSWHSRQIVVKMSDDARAKRSKSAGSACTCVPGHQYRRLTGALEGDAHTHEKLSDREKRMSAVEEAPPVHKDRRLSRVNPPRRPPVVYPEEAPRFLLLSCDVEGGRSVMKPLGSTDFIIPRYFRPKAPNLLRSAKNLDDLYNLGNVLFDTPYPSMDNHDWKWELSSRLEKKGVEAQEVSPVHTFH